MPNINTNGDPIESANGLKFFCMGADGGVGWFSPDALDDYFNERMLADFKILGGFPSLEEFFSLRQFLSLFRTRPGLWYDLQDLTTLFQDSVGILPVYRPGTGQVDPPVGLMLDKGQGLELGPEPTNALPADFNDLSTWTAWGTATVGAGGLVSGLKINTGDGAIFRYANAAFPAETYLKTRVRIKRVSTVGAVSIQHPSGGSTWGTGRFIVDLSKLSDDWEWVDELHPAVSSIIPWSSSSPKGNGGLYLRADNLAGQESLSVYVDSFFQSVRREIKGHHAYQETTTARPTLSGRYNLLTATETLSNQDVTTEATDYTFRFEGTGTVTLSGTAIGTLRVGKHTITCTAGTLTCTVAGSVTRADLRVKRYGSNLPAYQSVTDANTYDTAGFPLFLKRNKVDDDLIVQAPAITGSQGVGSTGGAVLGPVIIPAGTYTLLSEAATTGISEITGYVAIDGELTASEQAAVEWYVMRSVTGEIEIELPEDDLLLAASPIIKTIGGVSVLPSSVPVGANSTVQQVKGSGFAGAGSATVTGLLTTDTITATGNAPTCSVDGTLTFPGPDCWDVYVHRDGELWAYWSGINVGQDVEIDASGNGHTLYLTDTAITERVDGSGTNWANEAGFTVADGTQYLDLYTKDSIGVGWRIPAIYGGTGCAAYTLEV